MTASTQLILEPTFDRLPCGFLLSITHTCAQPILTSKIILSCTKYLTRVVRSLLLCYLKTPTSTALSDTITLGQYNRPTAARSHCSFEYKDRGRRLLQDKWALLAVTAWAVNIVFIKFFRRKRKLLYNACWVICNRTDLSVLLLLLLLLLLMVTLKVANFLPLDALRHITLSAVVVY